jgi:hypothetical protein
VSVPTHRVVQDVQQGALRRRLRGAPKDDMLLQHGWILRTESERRGVAAL